MHQYKIHAPTLDRDESFSIASEANLHIGFVGVIKYCTQNWLSLKIGLLIAPIAGAHFAYKQEIT